MTRPAWWVLLAAVFAPILLIGGWTIAAQLQPATYNPVRDTISSLARIGANDRWIMTVVVIGLGLCYVLIGFGLYAAATPGRLILIIGGLATMLVSVLPLPPVGTSQSHGVTAAIGFVALAIWPLAATGRALPGGTPWALRRPVAIGATIVLAALLIWFGVSLPPHHLVGLSERVAAAAEAIWPLVVVISVYFGITRQRASARVAEAHLAGDRGT